MATNTGKGYRHGQVADRIQVLNPTTGHYIKIDTESGRFMESKNTKFKGVRVKATKIKSNPAITKKTALKAERAVIAYKKKHPKQ